MTLLTGFVRHELDHITGVSREVITTHHTKLLKVLKTPAEVPDGINNRDDIGTARQYDGRCVTKHVRYNIPRITDDQLTQYLCGNPEQIAKQPVHLYFRNSLHGFEDERVINERRVLLAIHLEGNGRATIDALPRLNHAAQTDGDHVAHDSLLRHILHAHGDSRIKIRQDRFHERDIDGFLSTLQCLEVGDRSQTTKHLGMGDVLARLISAIEREVV